MSADAAVSVGMGLASVLVSAANVAVASSSSLSSTLSESVAGGAVTGLVGAANSWLQGLAEIAAPLPQTPTHDAGRARSSGDPSSAVASSQPEGIGSPLSGLATALFAAVEMSPPSSEGRNASAGSSSTRREDVNQNDTEEAAAAEAELSLADAIVRINTLTVAEMSIRTLIGQIALPADRVAAASPPSSGGGLASTAEPGPSSLQQKKSNNANSIIVEVPRAEF